MASTMTNTRGDIIVPDPPLAQFLFGNTRMAWFWLIARVYLGYDWALAGWHKVADGGAGWLDGGSALQGFWTNAVKIPETGRPPIAYDWYRSFIQMLLDADAYTWFAPLVAYGELLIGIALILGAFVGIAAFVGAFMNWNFVMAGAASTNGMLFAIAVLLMLAWKVAGWYGADRYLLPKVGTPWGNAGDGGSAKAAGVKQAVRPAAPKASKPPRASRRT
ncbi:MAG: DoxX family membrane protein [Ardenticatenia bacterium]|nr:DoxX family membrane protein [Ardenticatenia bacterium]